MKTKTSGTTFVPSHRASTQDVNTHQRRFYKEFLPADCKVKTSQDAWYLASIVSLCATVIFPPCVIALVYCVIKAQKGGNNE